MGGAYYDPSSGIFCVMEDAVDARGGFEVLIMRAYPRISHLYTTYFSLL